VDIPDPSQFQSVSIQFSSPTQSNRILVSLLNAPVSLNGLDCHESGLGDCDDRDGRPGGQLWPRWAAWIDGSGVVGRGAAPRLRAPAWMVAGSPLGFWLRHGWSRGPPWIQRTRRRCSGRR